MNIKIYYFSGTGNSLAAARQIGAAFEGSRIIPIAQLMQESDIKIQADAVVVIFPSYAYTLPVMVKRFLKKADIECDNIFLLTLYGTRPGNSLKLARRLVKKNGVKNIYSGKIISVENYISIFGQPSQEYVEKTVELQRQQTDKEIQAIKDKTTNQYKKLHPFAPVTAFLFTKLAVKLFKLGYKVLDTCTGCGVCADVCPTGCVQVEEGRAKFTKASCEHCQGCFNFCPQKALKFGRLTAENNRYYHPDVRANQMNK